MTLAIETFNQRFNKKIDFRRISPEKIKDLVRAIDSRGMKTELYMMYAFPNQTYDELTYDEGIVENILHADEVAWQNCMVFPGTEYYREGLRNGWFTEGSYRVNLKKGYFFHYLPDVFNFSKIPNSKIKAFRERHIPNVSKK